MKNLLITGFFAAIMFSLASATIGAEKNILLNSDFKTVQQIASEKLSNYKKYNIDIRGNEIPRFWSLASHGKQVPGSAYELLKNGKDSNAVHMIVPESGNQLVLFTSDPLIDAKKFTAGVFYTVKIKAKGKGKLVLGCYEYSPEYVSKGMGAFNGNRNLGEIELTQDWSELSLSPFLWEHDAEKTGAFCFWIAPRGDVEIQSVFFGKSEIQP